MPQKRAGRREGSTTTLGRENGAYGPPDPENPLFQTITPAVSRVFGVPDPETAPKPRSKYAGQGPVPPLGPIHPDAPAHDVPTWVYAGQFPNDPDGMRRAIARFAVMEHTTAAERAANRKYLAERRAHIAGTCKRKTCYWCKPTSTLARGR